MERKHQQIRFETTVVPSLDRRSLLGLLSSSSLMGIIHIENDEMEKIKNYFRDQI